jgi:signal peptidase II
VQNRRGKVGRGEKVVLSVWVAAATILADQVAKRAVVERIALCERVPILGDVLRFTNIRNSGAVFGIMRGSGSYFTLFSVVAAAVLIVVIYLARKSSILVRVSLGMVLGGALGNLIDRLEFGAVVDFIDIGFGEAARWPCFNIADAAITVGVVLLISNALRMSGSETSDEGDQIDSPEQDQAEDRQVSE